MTAARGQRKLSVPASGRNDQWLRELFDKHQRLIEQQHLAETVFNRLARVRRTISLALLASAVCLLAIVFAPVSSLLATGAKQANSGVFAGEGALPGDAPEPQVLGRIVARR